jgi:hypothetical protein
MLGNTAYEAGSEEIQSVHLAEALHASQPAETDDELAIDTGGNLWLYPVLARRIKQTRLEYVQLCSLAPA